MKACWNRGCAVSQSRMGPLLWLERLSATREIQIELPMWIDVMEPLQQREVAGGIGRDGGLRQRLPSCTASAP